MEKKIYDMLVVGGGPAGYTAALYAARAGMTVLVLEKLSAGGQMALSEQIDNYPGFPEGVDGFTLGEAMQQGAERFGAETVLADVQAVELEGNVKRLLTSDGDFYGKTVIIASGAVPRKLGIPEESTFTGKGVYYCAACDGMQVKGKTAVVIGGGNSAVHDALLLSQICSKVFLIHRRNTLRADKVYQKALLEARNITVLFESWVVSLTGTDAFSGVQIENIQNGQKSFLPCDGVFVSIGREPNSSLFKKSVNLDEKGYILADESTKTNIPGVFAAGDIRTKAFRQIVTAVSDGANAVYAAQSYLSNQ